MRSLIPSIKPVASVPVMAALVTDHTASRGDGGVTCIIVGTGLQTLLYLYWAFMQGK